MATTNVESTGELWKEVPGYEGLYEVSNLGRVRSLPRIIMCGPEKKIPKQIEAKIMSPNPKRGYLTASLCKHSRVKGLGIHRLVAMAFLPNPQNRPQVDHINGIRTDNRLINLRWATALENARNPNTQPQALAAIDKAQSSRWRKLIQRDLLTNDIIKVWPSIAEASRQMGVSNTRIWACCKGTAKTTVGFIWQYAPEEMSAQGLD